MSEKTSEKGHETKDIDVAAAGRGVWLVKVPKYLAVKWEKESNPAVVGKLRITRSKVGSQKPEVVFTSNDAILDQGEDASAFPRHYKFALTGMSNQNLTVFSQSQVPGSEQVAVEGKVIQRAECLPVADDNYMRHRKKKIEMDNVPRRKVIMRTDLIPLYKPRSHHISSLDDKRRSKDGEKRSRLDKEKVMDMLFAAFEKHQYYNVKDLVGITKQPIPYLKEILQEICVYNMKAPHRNMWELKPEFRHYK